MNAALNAWPYVVAAYAVTIAGTLALVGWSIAALRRAEQRADALDQQGRDR
jgi:nitrate reductase gamma subunit